MTITFEDVKFLTSVPGAELLLRLRDADLSDSNLLKLITRLRQEYTASETHAALTMTRLRREAAGKFGDAAGRMLFTDDALQQASDPRIRAYRTTRFEGAGRVLDVCCGIGADSIAFASAGLQVLGLDIDPACIAIARHNAIVLGLDGLKFREVDVNQGIPDGYPAIFFDPARRDQNGNRIFDVEQYIPPLSLVRGWVAERITVKLSPGVDKAQLEAYEARLEFISVDGELKEAVLWMDQQHHPPATLLVGDDVLHWDEQPAGENPLTAEPRQWLVEPDPALIRAGLVANAAGAFDGAQLDSTIAYFTTDSRPQSPWVRVWEIQDWMPFHVKKLRAYLRERGVGRVTVKKRGSPVTPEQLQKRLKLKGDGAQTLVLTQLNGLPIVLICAEYPV